MADKAKEFSAYIVKEGKVTPFTLKMGDLTEDERKIILDGCQITSEKGENR